MESPLPSPNERTPGVVDQALPGLGGHHCPYCGAWLPEDERWETENCCDPRPPLAAALNHEKWLASRDPAKFSVTSSGDLPGEGEGC